MNPLKILKGRKIDLNHIRVFGCTSFVHIRRANKFDKNSIRTIFLRYSFEKNGYKCYYSISQKMYISRDVSFFENEPYYKPESHDTSSDLTLIFSCNVFFPQGKFEEQGEHI
jgi:hypothetical protein